MERPLTSEKSSFTILESPFIQKVVHPASVVKEITWRNLEGTKMLFINMPLRESAPPVDAPQGPLLMATNLIKNYGVDTDIIDLNFYRVKDADAEKRGLPSGRHLYHKEARDL